MRGFYRISSALLLGLTPALLNAQSLCEDLRVSSRLHEADLADDGSLHADAGEVDLKAHGISRLTGGVRLRFARQILLADDVEYEQATRHLRVASETFFETDDVQVRAASADIRLDDERASFHEASYVAYAAGARGSAGELEIGGPGQATLRDVRYTTCPLGQEDWVLAGDEIRLDSVRGYGSARNARLRFKGVPLFWLPRFYFPVGDQRRSGLLAPRLGDGSNSGFDISVPIYWNIAPNYDLTFTPRHAAQIGEQYTTELRYLWSHSRGRSQAEFIDRDQRTGEQRYLFSSELVGGLQKHWIWQATVLKVSDVSYLSDVGSSEADEAQSFLPRVASLAYADRERGLLARLSANNYQSVLGTLAADDLPYTRWPELNLLWAPPGRNGALRPKLDLQVVNFRHDTLPEAWRGDGRAGLDWRLDLPQGFAATQLDYRYTAYRISQDGLSPQTQTRGLPVAKLGLGLNFLRAGRAGHHQTLSPQLQYLFVPYRDQSELPLLDTGQPDFSFDRLLADNRYTGADRIADANLITTALRTDWYRDNGRHRELSAKIGVQWRLEGSRVSLPGETPEAAGNSDWLGELDYAPNEHWRMQVVGQWNAEENQVDQGSGALRYQRSADRFAQVSYRFRRDNFDQTDVLASWPISSRWRLAGRWTYSLQDSRSLESMGGLEYRSCCWGAQVAWRRYLNGDGDDFNSSLYLQLELNGLGRIGEGLDRLLQRDIL